MTGERSGCALTPAPGPVVTPLMLITAARGVVAAPISQMRKLRLVKVSKVLLWDRTATTRQKGDRALVSANPDRFSSLPRQRAEPAGCRWLRPPRQEVSWRPASLPPSSWLPALTWLWCVHLSVCPPHWPGSRQGPCLIPCSHVSDVWGMHGWAPKRFFQ